MNTELLLANMGAAKATGDLEGAYALGVQLGQRALDAEASLVELAPAKRIEVGDRVEHIFADVDPRTVIAVGPDWLWLDFQQSQLAAGELPTFLPMRNYRRIG